MAISSNPLRSTTKSVETTVVSPVQDIDDGSEFPLSSLSNADLWIATTSLYPQSPAADSGRGRTE